MAYAAGAINAFQPAAARYVSIQCYLFLRSASAKINNEL
jgi:hypothetical protein